MSDRPSPPESVVEILRDNQRFLLTSHIGPDGDAVGSTLGLRCLLEALGKQVTMLLAGGVPYRYRWLAGSADVVGDLPADVPDFDCTVVLDTGSLDRLSDRLPPVERRGRVVNIDHHATNEGFAEVTWQDTSASSVGEMIAALAPALGVALTASAAQALFCAVMTDTGSFRFSNTRPASLRIAGDLVAAGADPAQVSTEVYFTHPLGRFQLLGLVLPTLEVSPDGRIATILVTQEMFAAVGGDESWTDEFIDFPRAVAGVEVAIQFREVGPNQYKASLRSRGAVNVAQVAEQFGGGGHPQAAGTRLTGTLDEVRATLLAALERAG